MIDSNKMKRNYEDNPLRLIPRNKKGGVMLERPTEHDMIYLMIELNLSRSVVAEYLGCSISKISQWCKEYKIKKSKECIQSIYKKTCLKKYGVENTFQNEEIKLKKKNTCLKKYGTEFYQSTDNFKVKVKRAKLERYGNENYNNIDGLKNTCLRKYGVENCSQKDWSSEQRDILLSKENLLLQFQKHNTKSRSIIAFKMGINHRSLCRIMDRLGIGSEYYNQQNSQFEEEIISHFPNETIETNVRILGGKEIDIYFPEHRLGIEFNGSYWHSEIHKHKNYHLDKTNIATKNGIRLIHVFEYEWNDGKDKIIKFINNILGASRVIHVRKCVVKEIDRDEKKKLLEENHLQGNDKSSIRLGLFHEDKLVSVMTFGKSKFNKRCEYEMHRYCSNSKVIGGTSKLFKYFLNIYKPKSVISYQNLAKFDGNMYEKLGFNLSHVSDPNYVWCDDDNNVFSKYQSQKYNLGEDVGTEISIMKDRGFFRIYDCGNNVWVFQNSI